MTSRITPRACIGPVAFGLVVAGSLTSGCSTTTAERTPVQAVFRFEGVRTGGGTSAASGDEWSAIRAILQKHSRSPIVEERRRRATIGNAEIADYRATLTLTQMAVADDIHREIDALRSSEGRMEFGLVDTQIAYRGNTVAAGVSLYVTGFATQGFRVRLFPGPATDPIELTAGRNGMWTTKLSSAPEDGWLYGLAEDPAGKVRTRYFRVNVSTQKQELVDEAEFWRRFPQWRPAVETPAAKADKKERK